MRVIDRIFTYLGHHRIAPYSFERACNIANGYLKKQEKGKGTVGSEILERIGNSYHDLNLAWLLTGKGKMIIDGAYDGELMPGHWSEDQSDYASQEHIIKTLRNKILFLENALADKEKIIKLLEQVKT